jgi:RecA/RadA recombinase
MAGRPFDVSKFRKTLTKSIEGLGVGFNDPTDWISTGNYALNFLISGDFHRGIPLGRVTVFAGDSGAGKSYICSGNVIKNAQEQGIFVVLVDSENALDESWLHALGVDTSEEKMLKLNMAMIDDVAKTISEFMKEYKAIPETERPKVLFVIDSLGMLLTPTDVNQFEAGEMKGDLGRKPKALTSLVRNCVNMFGSYNVGLVATNHTYASQDMFDPDDKISGGCLTAGHKVWMADGSSKNIEDIQVGDVVVTLDGDIDVSDTFTFADKEVFEIELGTGEIIKATGEHKFLTQTASNELVWRTLYDLNEGDHILQVV